MRSRLPIAALTVLLASCSWIGTPTTGEHTSSASSFAMQSSSQSSSTLSMNDDFVSSQPIARSSALLSSAVRSSAAPVAMPSAPSPAVVAWIPEWDQENSWQSYVDHAAAIDIVSFFWYQLTEQGSIKPYHAGSIDRTLIAKAHQNNAKVFVVIANLGSGEGDDWDGTRVERVIASRDARAAHIGDIAALVDDLGIDGVDLDYEAIEGRAKENFTLFVRELAATLHAKGKFLGLAIHPKTAENIAEEDNGSRAQDWKELAKDADYLYFMTFGEHTAGTEPGPSAPVSLVRRVFTYAKKLGIPPQKMVLDLPLFAEQWVGQGGAWESDGGEVTLRDAEQFMKDEGLEPQWDATAQAVWIPYETDGNDGVIWTENERSLRAKIDEAKRFNVRSVGLWRLGADTEDVWKALQ